MAGTNRSCRRFASTAASLCRKSGCKKGAIATTKSAADPLPTSILEIATAAARVNPRVITGNMTAASTDLFYADFGARSADVFC
jgi:hypothetical protein